MTSLPKVDLSHVDSFYLILLKYYWLYEDMCVCVCARARVCVKGVSIFCNAVSAETVMFSS